jgi:flagellin
MGLYINTNQSSLNAQRQLNSTTRSLTTSFERLSSGLRINGAKDDAAGLSITTRFDAQVKGLNQAVRNSNDGISLAQTAEGALNETTNILQRMRELSVQSANDTNNANDRASLNAEIVQLKAEIDRIADTTNFNGNKVLDGNFLMRDLQVGANVGETISVSISGAGSADLGRQSRVTGTKVTAGAIAGGNLNITGHKGSATIRNTVTTDDSVSVVHNEVSAIAKAAAINSSYEQTGVRAIVNETTTTFSDTIAGGVLDTDDFMVINGSKISGFAIQQGDADGALRDAINAVSDDTGVVASLSATGQLTLTAADGRNIRVEHGGNSENSTGVGAGPTNLINGLPNIAYNATGTITLQSTELFELSGSAMIGHTDGVHGVNSDFAVSSVDISERASAIVAIDSIDIALEDVSAARAQLGALQNRLESTINNLTTTSENLSASRSRILDADFAQETAQLSRNQIIQQAGVSILAQANQQPQIALGLLG